jgi:predicted DNA-binding helix-hairpin-helix protein
MELQRKLEILADAAKYDASCASSGTELRDSSDGKDLGSTAPGMGICHSYIEGLFLSSGIIRRADYTMEQVVSVARKLREEHHFRGYIHLKTIPKADVALIAGAGKYADCLSINIEMPLETSLAQFAPEKDVRAIPFKPKAAQLGFGFQPLLRATRSAQSAAG